MTHQRGLPWNEPWIIVGAPGSVMISRKSRQLALEYPVRVGRCSKTHGAGSSLVEGLPLHQGLLKCTWGTMVRELVDEASLSTKACIDLSCGELARPSLPLHQDLSMAVFRAQGVRSLLVESPPRHLGLAGHTPNSWCEELAE